MFERSPDRSLWRRIERRRGPTPGTDFVEVGECTGCHRGVDRAFPAEYRLLDGVLLCAECAQAERHAVGARGAPDGSRGAFSSPAVAADGAPRAPVPPA